jgi:hypothetical protein
MLRIFPVGMVKCIMRSVGLLSSVRSSRAKHLHRWQTKKNAYLGCVLHIHAYPSNIAVLSINNSRVRWIIINGTRSNFAACFDRVPHIVMILLRVMDLIWYKSATRFG